MTLEYRPEELVGLRKLVEEEVVQQRCTPSLVDDEENEVCSPETILTLLDMIDINRSYIKGLRETIKHFQTSFISQSTDHNRMSIVIRDVHRELKESREHRGASATEYVEAAIKVLDVLKAEEAEEVHVRLTKSLAKLALEDNPLGAMAREMAEELKKEKS